ncbi:hypothetical protein COCON_G00119820 [Conger conger]|uniref:Bardet-Biedl syndrome 12 protein n=1 Tax=Conger conger TaxID=82655 RepID=A0A9Q1DHF4_CONCO|nr:Bardet-Biedl syndrome 12 protein [Conger conger]XP_061107616.1 Bardet-Biedl syndrome 12 protein [Conger conger]XP_061107617.1 Bardet-Biedl syndrome 12 protein [Conger conger]KAJ8269375.1 hypothetical protein COCON_G00119820 [Conger conger]
MPKLGYLAVNQGRHIGLQQLAALAAAANAFLGPDKKFKFVEDQESGKSNMVCSSYRLLEQLDLSCAAGQLLNETVQAHQKVFGTGTGCLLFMVGVWSAAALECLQEGVPVQHIVSAMLEGLDSCLIASRGIRLPIKEAVCHFGSGGDKRPDRHRVPMGKGCLVPLKSTIVSSLSFAHDASGMAACRLNSRKTHKAETCKPQALLRGKAKIKLTHSRHFGPGEKTETGSSAAAMTPFSSLSGKPEPLNIAHLAGSVSHGCEDGMSLVVEACRIQMESNRVDSGRGTFDISKLVTCVLPWLPEGCATVLQGFLTLISEEQAPTPKLLGDRSLYVAVINGDLSESYRHLGFIRPADVRHTTGKLDSLGLNLESEWAGKTLMTLRRLKVDVLLVGGVVAESLRQNCIEQGLLVVERVTRGVLRDFTETTGAVAVTYVSQLDEDCVGKGARASMLRECGKAVAVNIQANGTLLVTVVISSCVSSKLQVLEDRFWGCAHRLYHAMGDGHVLPGAGVTEILCAHHLRELSKLDGNKTRPQGDSNSYRGVVLQYMAEGWMEYMATVMYNTAVCPSKLEAWTVINQSLKGLGAGTLSYACLLEHLHNDGGGVVVYDNVEAKLEAWRRALDLVLLVLQTDTEIITGLSTKDAKQESHLMLI